MKHWTPDDIRTLLMQPGDLGMHAVGKALVALLERQTATERAIGDTREHNGVGFSGFDGRIMTDMARFYMTRGFLSDKQLGYLRGTTEKVKTPRICKYAGQLADIARAKAYKKIDRAEIEAAGVGLSDAEALVSKMRDRLERCRSQSRVYG